ncbi:hypothetical protein GCM10025878_11320 [Leuconostoc gasicomitatum]|uniref:Uncharacterized protein n=2 Tax=Leuconostoc TaxID=1243 RepID=A0AAN2UFL6_9LACO|nr:MULTISPECIES: DUF6442 family protein [Leuconostoc]MBZ5957720.1 hypothetical protein [Leuconostoc gasicomitatum]MBZ5958906.1 hypothetical protein [Leuconostoc gasicomitatum]MBZ5965960.1 hypothetical protein [Leuconostoc gasicomitatum]MBZ5980499.1 hypothetical protein [Leuconostoc gasicomitatum]MBZ5981927.1 hypothetical protein [Leuconostoc gasicomitatum]
MNQKRFLKVAQQENNDEGQIAEHKNITVVHYIMLLVAWLFIFTVRLVQKEPTNDLFFMILLLALGHEAYLFKRKSSFFSIITIIILLIATIMTAWSIVGMIFK